MLANLWRRLRPRRVEADPDVLVLVVLPQCQQHEGVEELAPVWTGGSNPLVHTDAPAADELAARARVLNVLDSVYTHVVQGANR